MENYSLCFVCLGNICRSPTAEGIMLHLVRQSGLEHRVHVESAATGSWHLGHAADPRSIETAARHGIVLDKVALPFTVDHFKRFSLILPVDIPNRDRILSMAKTSEDKSRVRLLRSFDSEASADAEVPDPYQGGIEGFEEVFAMCYRACEGLLGFLKQALKV